jgi:hypothetical protein
MTEDFDHRDYTLTMAAVVKLIDADVLTVKRHADSDPSDPDHIPNWQKYPGSKRVQRFFKPEDVQAWLKRGLK